MKKRNLFSLFSIVIFVGTCIIYDLLFNLHKYPEYSIRSDVIWYYEYLTSTFIKKDTKMSFIGDGASGYKNGTEEYWSYVINGNHINKTTMGTAIMYSPAFFVAHILAKAFGYNNNGYTAPYATALIIITMIYVMIGLLLLRRLLLFYFSDIITAISILIIGITTNLLYYTTREGLMTHAYSFFLFACFIYLTKKWFDNPKWKYSIFIGIVFGLISLIRPTNALIIIVFMLFGIKNFKDIKKQFLLFLKNYKKIIIIILLSFLVWIPQLCYWKYVTDSWFFYSYVDNERFFFNNPHIIQFLFGFRKGWLLYTPVMIFSLIGLFFVWKNNREYFFPLSLFIIINIYVLSSWWCWWFGGGFGMRALIETYALLIIPLAAFLKEISKSKLFLKIPIYFLVGALASLSFFHFIRYKYFTIHWESMNKKTYFEYFFSLNDDSRFYELLEEPDYEAARKGIDKTQNKDK